MTYPTASKISLRPASSNRPFAPRIEHTDETKLQVDVVGLDLTALIDTRQVVE